LTEKSCRQKATASISATHLPQKAMLCDTQRIIARLVTTPLRGLRGEDRKQVAAEACEAIALAAVLPLVTATDHCALTGIPSGLGEENRRLSRRLEPQSRGYIPAVSSPCSRIVLGSHMHHRRICLSE